jgi:D-lactate dehydrogenase (cytochrome)
VCVPISRLAECVLETKRDIEHSKLLAPLVGHAGDGNFHLNIVIDPSNPDELAQVKAFNQRLVKRALDLGGTSTGEHGIGTGKMGYLVDEHGSAVEVMKAIKRALDPDNRMNPGKIFQQD